MILARVGRRGWGANSIQITTGSIRVNQGGGTLQGNNVVTLNQEDGVVAASTVRLTQPSTCAALFANSGNGAGQCQPVQPIPAPQPPGVELSGEMLNDIQLGFVIGEHCSTGQLSLVNLRRKGRSVVYP